MIHPLTYDTIKSQSWHKRPIKPPKQFTEPKPIPIELVERLTSTPAINGCTKPNCAYCYEMSKQPQEEVTITLQSKINTVTIKSRDNVAFKVYRNKPGRRKEDY